MKAQGPMLNSYDMELRRRVICPSCYLLFSPSGYARHVSLRAASWDGDCYGEQWAEAAG